jgi:hypothetical protein
MKRMNRTDGNARAWRHASNVIKICQTTRTISTRLFPVFTWCDHYIKQTAIMRIFWPYFVYIFRLESCGLPGLQVRIPALEIFLFSRVSKSALGPTQPFIQWILGTLFLRVKQPEREFDHSPPSSAEVKNDRAKSLLLHTSSWRGA